MICWVWLGIIIGFLIGWVARHRLGESQKHLKKVEEHGRDKHR